RKRRVGEWDSLFFGWEEVIKAKLRPAGRYLKCPLELKLGFFRFLDLAEAVVLLLHTRTEFFQFGYSQQIKLDQFEHAPVGAFSRVELQEQCSDQCQINLNCRSLRRFGQPV